MFENFSKIFSMVKNGNKIISSLKKAKNKIYLFIFPQMMIKMVKRMKIVRYPFQVRFHKKKKKKESHWQYARFSYCQVYLYTKREKDLVMVKYKPLKQEWLYKMTGDRDGKYITVTPLHMFMRNLHLTVWNVNYHSYLYESNGT